MQFVFSVFFINTIRSYLDNQTNKWGYNLSSKTVKESKVNDKIGIERMKKESKIVNVQKNNFTTWVNMCLSS